MDISDGGTDHMNDACVPVNRERILRLVCSRLVELPFKSIAFAWQFVFV